MSKKVSKRPPGTCKPLSNPMSSKGFPLSATQEALGAPVHVGQLGQAGATQGEKRYVSKGKGGELQSEEVRQDIAKLLLAIDCRNI